MSSKYFKAYELVSKKDYEALGPSKVFEIIDPRLLASLDAIKEKFPNGSMYVNNWKWGLDREWSGLRTPNSPYYSLGSMHSYGKAADFIFTDYTAAEVRKYIIDNPQEFPYVKGIENFKGMTWVHIDVRDSDSVVVFNG